MPELKRYLLHPLRLLREPRLVSLLYLLTYLAIAGGIGLPTLIAAGYIPPPMLHPVLVATIGLLNIAGGLAGALSLHGGLWWLERFGITLCIGGSIARMTAVAYLAQPPDFWQRETALVVVCLLLAVRLMWISGLALDPTK